MLVALLAMLGMGLLYVPLSPGPAALVFLLNAASLGAMAYDKSQAQLRRTRVPEAALHGLCLLGGAGGALGRALFNHKTQNPSFTVSTVAGTALLWSAVFVLPRL